MTSSVLRLRTKMRAAFYNPDRPNQVRSLEAIADIYPGLLADVVAGRTPLDHHMPIERLNRILSDIAAYYR